MGTGGSAGAGVARWFHPLRRVGMCRDGMCRDGMRRVGMRRAGMCRDGMCRVGMCRDGIAQGSALVGLKLGFLRGAGRGALPEGTYRIWGLGGL